MRKYLALLPLFLVLVVPGVRSESASVIQNIRFGWHDTYARLVLDIQQDAAYRVRSNPTQPSIVVDFPKVSGLPAKAVWQVQNPLIRTVRFHQEADGLVGEIVLKQPGVVQRHFRMDKPSRIVIDITRQPSQVAKSKPQPPASTLASSPAASETPPLQGPPPGQTPAPEAPSEAKLPAQEASPANPEGAPRRQTTASQAPVPDHTTLPANTEIAPGIQVQTPPVPTILSVLSRNQLLRHAEQQWESGDLQAAHHAYQTFLKRFPDYKHNHFIRVRLADILQQQQQLPEALEAYANVLDTYPASEGAIISKMRMAELGVLSPGLLPDDTDARLAAYHRPIETLHDLLRTFPVGPLANITRFKIGELHALQEEPEKALATFRELLTYQLQPELLDDSRHQIASAVEKLMIKQEQDGAFVDALRLFFDNRAYLPPEETTHASLRLHAAISYARLGLFPEAQSLLVNLMTSSTAPAVATAAKLEQARLLSQQGHVQEALDLLEPAIPEGDSPLRGPILQTVGSLALQAKAPARAIGYLEMALNLASTATERVPLLSLLAQGYLAQGDSKRAFEALRQCAAAGSQAASSPLAAAEACQFRVATSLQASERQPQQALTAYNVLLDTFPQTAYRDQSLFSMANLYDKMADDDNRLQTLEALRTSTTHSLWRKVAADAIAHHEWETQFAERLADLLQTPPQQVTR